MTNNRLYKSFTQYYTISLSSLLGFVLIFNIGIDPYGDFRLIDIPGINKEKTLSFNSSPGERRSKANEFASEEYDTIILGTSRALRAINPQHQVFKNDRAYNLALRGSNMYEIHKIYQYARKKQKLKKVIFSLDLLTFSEVGTTRGDFNLSRFSSEGYLFRVLGNYISLDNFIISLKTLKNNYQGLKAKNKLGFDTTALGDQSEKTIDYRYRFDAALTQNTFVLQRSYVGYSYSQNRLELFREIVADCLANDIELYLFISPVHARHLEAITIMGLFPTFEQWKRDLVTIVAEESEKLNKKPPLVWDFSGYNTITTEEIPLAGEKGTMRWYHESSHYTQELGDMLLNIMFSYPQKVAEAPEDFGTIINPKNIEQHLAEIREEQKLYRTNYAFEIAEVKRLYQSVQNNPQAKIDSDQF